MTEIAFDRTLIEKYNISGPRYTSYPTVLQFDTAFNIETYRRIARQSNDVVAPRDLSLYFHLPFCARLCYYCACNKIVTKKREQAIPYLARLQREIELQAQLYDRTRSVRQLHWGGGTPTFLSEPQMRALMAAVSEPRHHAPDTEQGGGARSGSRVDLQLRAPARSLCAAEAVATMRSSMPASCRFRKGSFLIQRIVCAAA